MNIWKISGLVGVVAVTAIGLNGCEDVNKGKSLKALSNMQAIKVSLMEFSIQSRGAFPTQEQGLDALVERPTVEPIPERWRQYLEPEQLVDPWGNQYQYRYPGEHGLDGYDLWSLGADGEESDDDVRNW